jgi:hypothetical protein
MNISTNSLPEFFIALCFVGLLFGYFWLYPLLDCFFNYPKTRKRELLLALISGVPVIGGFLYLYFLRPEQDYEKNDSNQGVV